jgi:uncharacterized membrane protein YecN with MAPEG domain
LITFFYAGILAILYFYISFQTIKMRQKYQISLGSGPKNEIENYTSAHANFNAYVPILILLTYFLELSMTSSYWLPFFILHLFGIAIVLGRIFHYRAFTAEKMNFKFRKLGMYFTLWPLMVLGILNIIYYLWNSFL